MPNKPIERIAAGGYRDVLATVVAPVAG